MQAQVRKVSADVYVKGGLEGFPDPESLAKKYDVEFGSKSEAESKASMEAQILQQLEFTQRHQALLHKVEAKNMEVERMCVLLEALEPVPGMDAAKYKRLIDNPDSGDHVDVRDSKIVMLAKKVRKVQMSLNKERSISQAQAQDIEELKNTNDKLRKEIDALSVMSNSSMASSSSRTIRAPVTESPGRGAATAAVVDPAELELQNTQLRKDLHSVNKTVEELRRKLAKATDDAKNLSQALAREVGDGVSIEQAVDGGWRGRAQQIIMLKTKIKRLEASAGLNATAGSAPTANTHASRHHRGIDVDSQAESGLAEMSNERKIAIDTMFEERAKLIDDHQKLEVKYQGQRARIRKMEEDAQTHRQQLKIVLDKSSTDDELIGALRREITRLQQNSSAASRQDMAKFDVAVRNAGVAATSAAESEISRLKRQLQTQSDQLATQAQRIRELTARR